MNKTIISRAPKGFNATPDRGSGGNQEGKLEIPNAMRVNE